MTTVIRGVVRRGDRRGRRLGFPTANIHEVGAIAKDGVYAGTLQIEPIEDGPAHAAVISVGHRPTYYGRQGLRLLEAHVLDFAADLYGLEVRVELHDRMRPQRVFSDSVSLIRQLHLDVETTRLWAQETGLAAPPPRDKSARPRRSRGRWGLPQVTRDRRDLSALEREVRRTELVAMAVRHAPPDELDHAWVARTTGLPLGYLRWRYPGIDDLHAAVPVASD